MEQNPTIPIIKNLPGKKFTEGFIHDIHLDGTVVYKLAKPCFPDYLSYATVAHELINMRYLEAHGFLVPPDYEIFRCEAGYGLRMSFVSGEPLSSEGIFEDLLKSAATITESWAGPPDNRFESWDRYLQFTVTRQLAQIRQIPQEDSDYLCRVVGRVKITTNCLLLIDANLKNVIVKTDGSLCLLDMDRLILGDPRFQRVYLQYQRGKISLSESPETWLDLLYAVLITVEDIFFRSNHSLDYANELEFYMHLRKCLKQCSIVSE